MRLTVLVFLIRPIAPVPPRLLPDSPQHVKTTHPIVCTHTRLTDEVESWKIQRTLQWVREMGASSIVEFFPWAYVEGYEGRYDWAHPDRIIGLARAQGLTVIARLGIVPLWARPKESGARPSGNSLQPEYYDAYARFVGEFARRYRDQVQYIIPWNEPNLSFEWGYRSVSPAEYTDFLERVYVAAHAANPSVIVLGGALAPTNEPDGSTNAVNDLAFLRGMYAAGGARYFDALAVHTYDLTKSPPETPPAPDRLNFRRVELLRAIMLENGDTRPLYITESGWNDHPRWVYAVSPGERIAHTLDSFRLAEREWPYVRALCSWNFRTPSNTRGYPDYWQFVTPDFQKRAIYDALKAYATGEESP